MWVGWSNRARSKSFVLPVRGAPWACSEPFCALWLALCVPQAAAKSITNKEMKMMPICRVRISGFLCWHLPLTLALPEAKVQRGQNEQVKQRRGHQPSQYDDRHGVLYLITGDAARYRQRYQRKPGSPCGHQDRGQPLLRPTQHESGPKLLPFFAL